MKKGSRKEGSRRQRDENKKEWKGRLQKLLGFRGLSIISGQITEISGANIVWSTWAEHAHTHGREKEN